MYIRNIYLYILILPRDIAPRVLSKLIGIIRSHAGPPVRDSITLFNRKIILGARESPHRRSSHHQMNRRFPVLVLVVAGSDLKRHLGLPRALSQSKNHQNRELVVFWSFSHTLVTFYGTLGLTACSLEQNIWTIYSIYSRYRFGSRQ